MAGLDKSALRKGARLMGKSQGMFFPPFAPPEREYGSQDWSQVSQDLLKDAGPAANDGDDGCAATPPPPPPRGEAELSAGATVVIPATPDTPTTTHQQQLPFIDRRSDDVDINALPEVAAALHAHSVPLSAVRNAVEVGTGPNGEPAYIVTAADAPASLCSSAVAVHNPIVMPLAGDGGGLVLYLHSGVTIEEEPPARPATAPPLVADEPMSMAALAAEAARVQGEATRGLHEEWVDGLCGILRQVSAVLEGELEWYSVAIPLLLSHRAAAPSAACTAKADRVLLKIMERLQSSVAEEAAAEAASKRRKAPTTPLNVDPLYRNAFHERLCDILKSTPSRPPRASVERTPLQFKHVDLTPARQARRRVAEAGVQTLGGTPAARWSGQKRKAAASAPGNRGGLKQHAAALLAALADDDDEEGSEGAPPSARAAQVMEDERQLEAALAGGTATPEKEKLLQFINQGNQDLMWVANFINKESEKGAKAKAKGGGGEAAAAEKEQAKPSGAGQKQPAPEPTKEPAKPATAPALFAASQEEGEAEEGQQPAVPARRSKTASVSRQLAAIDGGRADDGDGDDDDDDADADPPADMAARIKAASQDIAARTPRTKQKLMSAALQLLAVTPGSADTDGAPTPAAKAAKKPAGKRSLSRAKERVMRDVFAFEGDAEEEEAPPAATKKPAGKKAPAKQGRARK